MNPRRPIERRLGNFARELCEHASAHLTCGDIGGSGLVDFLGNHVHNRRHHEALKAVGDVTCDIHAGAHLRFKRIGPQMGSEHRAVELGERRFCGRLGLEHIDAARKNAAGRHKIGKAFRQ